MAFFLTIKCNEDSAFALMKPQVFTTAREYYDTFLHDIRFVSFSAYINRDFLEALLDLDVKGKLIEVNTPEVKALYEEYFRSEMKKKRKPYAKRPPKFKRLKRPNKDDIID